MFINIKSELKALKRMLDDNIPKEEFPQKGNLIVIDGPLNFDKTDGYIQFMKIALDEIPNAYGEQNEKWKNFLDQIYNTAEKLQDAAVRFTGNTSEDFKLYCEKISHVLETDAKAHLDMIPIDIMATDNPVAFLEKHSEKGNTRAFLFYEDEDPTTWFMDSLMNTLSEIKIEKTTRQYDISRFLINSGYHEHIHDALNIIMSTAVYAINCSSSRKQNCYDFDVQKVNGNLRYVELIIKRIEHLV